MCPVSGSISTSATCTPFGKVSGVSVVDLGIEVLLDRAALLQLGRARRELEQRDAAVGADDAEIAARIDDVGFRGFEQHRGDALALFER